MINISKRHIKTDSRTRNAMLNSLALGIMKACSLACSLIIVPITIDYLNNEIYGVWMAISSTLYWFAFMDVGLGNGMRNYMAEAFSKGDMAAARSYFSTALFILSIIGIVIGLVLTIGTNYIDLNDLFNTHSISSPKLVEAVTIVIGFSMLQFITKNIGMVYIAMQKYAVNDFIVLIGNVCSVLIIYVLTKTTKGNLSYVVAAFTSVPAIMYIVAAIPLLHKYPQLKPSTKCIDWHSAKQITYKGLGFFMIQITSCLVIFGSTNVFISHFCGPEQVTVYQTSFKFFNVLIIGFTILISPLWNAYTDAKAKGDYGWIRKTFTRSLKLWGATIAGGIFMLAISGWFYYQWVGDKVIVPFSVSVCVLLYVCSFNLNNCVTYLLNGLNKIRVQIITSVVFTILFLSAIQLMGNQYGVAGIITATAVAYLGMAVVHLYQCFLIINQKAHGIWDK